MISTNMLMRAFISFSLHGIPSLFFRRLLLELVFVAGAAPPLPVAEAKEDEAPPSPVLYVTVVEPPELFLLEPLELPLPLLPFAVVEGPPNVIFTSRAPANPPFPASDLR
jgi:hypothetical protein